MSTVNVVYDSVMNVGNSDGDSERLFVMLEMPTRQGLFILARQLHITYLDSSTTDTSP